MRRREGLYKEVEIWQVRELLRPRLTSEAELCEAAGWKLREI